MSFEKVLKRWDRLLTLTALRATGTKGELAGRLGVGKTTIERDVNTLNEITKMKLSEKLGKPIVYDKKAKCYVFDTGQVVLNP